MAALLEPLPNAFPAIRDLRSFTSDNLEGLLVRETREWDENLDWDFSRSADLVRRFVDMRALNGAALLDRNLITGYCYYVFEEYKGLVGDLFVLPEYRSRERELLLLHEAVHEMITAPFITRIESQLMLSPRYPPASLPYPDWVRSYERNFMLVDLNGVRDLPLRELTPGIRFDNWTDYHQEAAAHLIGESYRHHVDSSINDQYRSVPGARRFLYNIVNYPGCGIFSTAASLVAVAPSGVLAGLSLTSVVNDRTGHITQICVAPEYRGTGVGYELLRRSLLRLLHAGCRRASLTVTSNNVDAVRLYLQTGFKTSRQFYAYVWEGWKG